MKKDIQDKREFCDIGQGFTRLHFQSDSVVKRLLERLHPGSNPSDIYQSAANVAACARQANSFESAAEDVEVAVQPLLRYYAILHWMKTLLYLRDLSFPPSTSVLQHGISVRRMKRQPFRWPLEAIYVYKEGVLQSFCTMACPNLALPQRFVVGDLLGRLPRLVERFSPLYHHFQHVYPLESGAESSGWVVSRKIAANAGMTVDEWKENFLVNSSELPTGSVVKPFSVGSDIQAPLHEPPGFLHLPAVPSNHPWLVCENERKFLLDSPQVPLWLCHFVILYTLSALCRYNPLEWSDALTWSNEADAFLIRSYLAEYPLDVVTPLLFKAAAVSVR